MKYVIIGASAAGISAAKTIRAHTADHITIIATDEAVYSRCMLHHYIGGGRTVEGISFIPPDFFESQSIIWRPSTTVTLIDTDTNTVHFEGGSECFDRLLIASGAESIMPPVEGLEGVGNVFGLRHITDARAITEAAKNANNIVIIGAGLVGLDGAYGLLQQGKKPTIVEMADTLMPQNLDPQAAAVYQKAFTEGGCQLLLGRKVALVQGDAQGQVALVTLDNGQVLPCDLLVVAVGVRPGVDILEGSNIAHGRGVLVDKYLATSATGVYAAGDITGIAETWPDAQRQGEVAALNMCGISTPYDDIVIQKNVVSFFNVATISLGQTVPHDGDIAHVRESQGNYQKIILRDGVPVGAIFQGDIARSGIWQHLIKHKVNISHIAKPIWKVSFADAYGLGEDGEYIWT